MNFTPASSSDFPSGAIFTRVSESGTRLMQTAMFMGESLELRAHARQQMPRLAGCEESLYGRSRFGGVACKRAERCVSAVQHVRHHDAQLVAPEAHLQREVGNAVVGEPRLHVFLVPAENLLADVAGIPAEPDP